MRITLENLSLDHSQDFLRWISKKEAVHYSLSIFQTNRDQAWVRAYISEISNDASCWNQVITANGKSIGYCGLSNISRTNSSAEYYILIGDVEYWNRGIGTMAGFRTLAHGFNKLGLHRIGLTVSSPNSGAVRSYEKIGFHREGVMREACNRENAFHDKIIMGILCDEWQGDTV